MTDCQDLLAPDSGVPGDVALPAWLAAIRKAADEDFDSNPGRPDAPPEFTARIRRAFPPRRPAVTRH